MNNLSIFLYLVDVLDGIESFAVFAAIVAFLISVGAVVTFLIASMEANNRHRSDESKEEDNKIAGYGKACFKKSIPAFFILSITVLIVPSTKTMYLIMGSEASEEVINSETGKRVQNAINKKLDEYLGKPKENTAAE